MNIRPQLDSSATPVSPGGLDGDQVQPRPNPPPAANPPVAPQAQANPAQPGGVQGQPKPNSQGAPQAQPKPNPNPAAKAPAAPRAQANPAQPGGVQGQPKVNVSTPSQPRAVAPAGKVAPPPPRPAAPTGLTVALPDSMSTLLIDELLNFDPLDLLRRKRNLFLLRVLIFIGLPTLFSAFYSYIYATPRFVSEVQIVYRDVTGSQTSGGLVSDNQMLAALGSLDMIRVLDTFVQSAATLDAVDAKVDLRSKLSDPTIDWWDRMPKTANREKFLKYYLHRITTFYQTGGFLTVDVEAFSAKDAQDIAAAIFAACDKMVSDLYLKPRQDMVQFTKAEMLRYQNELFAATDRVTVFREKHYDYDLSGTVTLLTSLVGGLQQQLAQAKAELASYVNYLGENAPTLVVLKTKIASLEAQIAEEQHRLASTPAQTPGQREPYSQAMATYLYLTQAQDFAKTTFQNSKTAYEAALLNLAKQPAYVVSFVPPTLPDKATEPDGLRNMATTFIASLVLYAIFSLVLGTLREQTGM